MIKPGLALHTLSFVSLVALAVPACTTPSGSGSCGSQSCPADGGTGGCSSHSTCDTCVADTSCGWCAATMQCMPGAGGIPDQITNPGSMCAANFIMSGGAMNCSAPPADAGTVSESPTTLPVDCRPMQNTNAPHCLGEGYTPGALGSGPVLQPVNILAKNGGCFYDMAGNRIVIVNNDDSGGGATQQGVFSVDAMTGNRTLVSGVWNDPSMGTVMRGTGPALGTVQDVMPTPSSIGGGGWLVANENQILRVDPMTGNRTLYWDGTSPTSGCVLGGQMVPTFSGDLTIASDGTIYLLGSYTYAGVYAVHGGTCTVVMAPGTHGTGPMFGNDPDFVHIFVDPMDHIYFTELLTNGVYKVDRTTGNWTTVSDATAGMTVGMGGDLGSGKMTWSDSKLWVLGDVDQGAWLTAVDPASGNRIAYSWNSESYHFLDGDSACLAPVPGHTWFVNQSGGEMIYYEPSTGLGYAISY